MKKIKKNKNDKNVTHLLHSQQSMLCLRKLQATVLNKFKNSISFLTTAMVLLNESGSELAQTGLSRPLIGPDRLETKVDL